MISQKWWSSLVFFASSHHHVSFICKKRLRRFACSCLHVFFHLQQALAQVCFFKYIVLICRIFGFVTFIALMSVGIHTIIEFANEKKNANKGLRYWVKEYRYSCEWQLYNFVGIGWSLNTTHRVSYLALQKSGHWHLHSMRGIVSIPIGVLMAVFQVGAIFIIVSNIK